MLAGMPVYPRVVIRPFQPVDAAAVLALVRELLPLRVESEASLRQLAEQSRCWIAEDDEAHVIGFGRVSGRRLWIGVRPSARGRGVGSALWARVEGHAHEPAICWTDTDEGRAFAEARGFRRTAIRIVSTLDVAAADVSEPQCPEGVELVPWSTLESVPTDLEGIERATTPDLAPTGSFVALLAGRPVAFALITTDERGVAENEFTATLAEFRGRGLATLCKQETVRWARANGIRTIVTGNDSENAAMLAVNRKLGYRPAHRRIELARR